MNYETFRVDRHRRAPLVEFIVEALQAEGCRLLYTPPPDEAPFRFVFETPSGERLGIIVYAFTATFTPTKGRPADEHSFQIKYGSKNDNRLHDLWHDPTGMYTTLLLGINPEQGFFVGIDPVLNSPTRLFIRVEFKQEHVDEILSRSWHYWERPLRRQFDPAQERGINLDEPEQIVVGGTKTSFLKYVLFERQARDMDQGHRQLLAAKAGTSLEALIHAAQETVEEVIPTSEVEIPAADNHQLAAQFELSAQEILNIIQANSRLLMAVRGGIAEEHLVRQLRNVPGVSDCERLTAEGAPDVTLRFEGSRPLVIECKNVLKKRSVAGYASMDFMKTRPSQNDRCTRFYTPDQFDVVAACLHAVTQRWEFSYVLPSSLDPHPTCPGRLSSRVKIDERWDPNVRSILAAAANK